MRQASSTSPPNTVQGLIPSHPGMHANPSFSVSLSLSSCFFCVVCELDLVFSLHKALLILFEMYIGGKLCESNKREVLKSIVEAEEMVEEMSKPGEDAASQLDDGLSFQEQFQLGRTPGRRGAAASGAAPSRAANNRR
jgi:hypothetical protein